MLRVPFLRIFRVVDLSAAMLLFYVVEGFEYGSTDDTAFVPWVYRWTDPSLYLNDLRFGDWPSIYYYPHIAYMISLAKVMPIEWGLIVTSILAALLLVIAMQKLAERLAGRYVPALLIALLLVGYFNAHFVAGYYLSSRFFSTHYVALAFIVLAMAWFMEGRLWGAGAALLPAAVMNPRLGAIGVGFIALLWFWPQPAATKKLLAVLMAVVGVAAIGLLAALLSAQLEGNEFEQVLRGWTFIRSALHYAPAAWNPFVFVNIALVGGFLLVMWRTRRDIDSRTLCFAALFCLIVIVGGIVNNYWMIVPTLVLGNPFQLGPLVLALCYVFMASVLVERLANGRFLSTLSILVVPDLQARLLLLIATLFVDRHAPSAQPKRASVWPLDAGEKMALAAQAITFLVARLVLTGSWQQLDYALVWKWRLVLVAVSVAGILVASSARALTSARLVAITGIGYVFTAYYIHTVHGIRVNSAVDRDMLAMCRYVVDNTSRDAVFITPPAIGDFQAHCRRASFFSFVHLPLRLERIPEWITRLGLLRLVPPDTDFTRLDRPFVADMSAYARLSADDFQKIERKYGNVEFVVVAGDKSMDLPLVYQNQSYRLYGLKQR